MRLVRISNSLEVRDCQDTGAIPWLQQLLLTGGSTNTLIDLSSLQLLQVLLSLLQLSRLLSEAILNILLNVVDIQEALTQWALT